MPKDTEFELWQDGTMVASVSAANYDDAKREILHYASQYGQDGPVEIRSPDGRVLAAI